MAAEDQNPLDELNALITELDAANAFQNVGDERRRLLHEARLEEQRDTVRASLPVTPPGSPRPKKKPRVQHEHQAAAAAAAAPVTAAAPAAASWSTTAASSPGPASSSGTAWSEHRWAVRGWHVGRSNDLTPEEIERLRGEEGIAREAHIPWRDRGPQDDAVQAWRGQPWRRGDYGGQRGYRKRGGQNVGFYNQLARQGALMPSPTGAFRVAAGAATATIQANKGKGKSIERGLADI